MLLKLSDEMFGGPEGAGIHTRTVERIAGGVSEIATETAVALVIGAGNIVRGKELRSAAAGAGIRRVTADQIGDAWHRHQCAGIP